MINQRPFAIADVPTGVLNALAKSIMRQTGQTDAGEAIRLVTSGEYLVKKPKREWRQQGGTIYLEVTSDGTTGPGWINRLKRQGVGLHMSAINLLRSSEFIPTRGVTYRVVILKCEPTEKKFHEIRVKADTSQLKYPKIEVACLIRESFSDHEIKAMGISWIHVMHEPVLIEDVPTILSVYCSTHDADYENFIWVQPEQKDSSNVDADVGFAYVM